MDQQRMFVKIQPIPPDNLVAAIKTFHQRKYKCVYYHIKPTRYYATPGEQGSASEQKALQDSTRDQKNVQAASQPRKRDFKWVKGMHTQDCSNVAMEVDDTHVSTEPKKRSAQHWALTARDSNKRACSR
jgi:hypothetical protein